MTGAILCGSSCIKILPDLSRVSNGPPEPCRFFLIYKRTELLMHELNVCFGKLVWEPR